MEDNIKEIIKAHLKIKTEYKSPISIFDGFIRTTLYWDDEIIDDYKQPISKASTLF